MNWNSQWKPTSNEIPVILKVCRILEKLYFIFLFHVFITICVHYYIYIFLKIIKNILTCNDHMICLRLAVFHSSVSAFFFLLLLVWALISLEIQLRLLPHFPCRRYVFYTVFIYVLDCTYSKKFACHFRHRFSLNHLLSTNESIIFLCTV